MALILFYDLAMVSYYDTRIIILISLIIQGFKQEQCNKQNLEEKRMKQLKY